MALNVPGLCGWVGDSGVSPDGQKALLHQLVVAQPWITGHADEGVLAPNCACRAAGGQNLGEAQLLTAIVGRHYWRDERLEGVRRDEGDCQALSLAWRERGADLLNDLGGEFAVLIHDADAGRTLLATDRMARYPVYWANHDGAIVFGGSVDAVAAFPGLDTGPTPQGLFHYVFFHMVPGPDSFFSGIHKLGAAERLLVQDGRTTTNRYWLPRFEEESLVEPAAVGGELLTAIEDAVRGHVTDAGATGAFLSGGLDSSTVAGVLGRVEPGAPTFSIGFDAEGYDEMAYARIAREHFGLEGHEYYVGPDDILDALPRVAGAYDEPFGNSSALPAYFCARMAREKGMRRLLAGDGGDELFAGNERYVKQSVFGHYHRVPGWLRNALVEPLVAMLPTKLPLVSKAQSYIRQANVPLPERLQQYNFLVQLAAEDVFDPEVLRDVDRERPFELQRKLYGLPADATELNRMLFLDWQHTLADNDLRKVSRMCELAGVEVAYPLLDDRVIDFSTRVPSRQKIDRGRLRHFYKEAIRGFLPDAILTKSKHGFGLPFGVWTRSHEGLRQLVLDNLERLKQRGLFRDDFIDHAQELHRTGHAAYYGELIWILMMLELWFGAREQRVSQGSRISP